MATNGERSEHVFTSNPIGGKPGDSDGLKRNKTPDGINLSAYPQDNVHGVSLPNCTGDTMAGSATNLAHSLSGTSAVQRQQRATRYKE